MKLQLSGLAILALCAGCSTSKVSLNTNDKSERNLASDATCEVSGSLNGEQKQSLFFDYQKNSINQVLLSQKNPDMSVPEMNEITQGVGSKNSFYVQNWFYPQHRLLYASEAIHATTKFLAPSVSDSVGYKSLKPTFDRKCELFEEPQTKMVHALGTLGTGRMIIYPRLQKLDANDQPVGEVDNPFTGLLQYRGNENGIPLLLRFSIANPVGSTIEVGGKSLLLEFIPGLGIKFLIDGKRSIDLVAMESLAGQGSDQNFFKYEFSPDFSAHAPSGYNTATGDEQKQILARYDKNLVNSLVMNWVGKRFFEIIPAVTGIPAEQLKPHSNEGPHPFLISIQNLAQMDSKGNAVDANSQKRPWRLVFKPALNNLDEARHAVVTSAVPYRPGRVDTDFRYKLSALQPNDRVYYVIAETEDKKRFGLGEIVLTSAVSPSPFADRLYFVQHQLDMRKTTFAKSIVSPEGH